MSERKLYVCGSCHQFWSSDRAGVPCPSCGGRVYPVDKDYNAYAALSAEEKAAFKEEYLKTHTFEAAEAAPSRLSSLAQDENLWIRGLDVALNITLGLCLVAAVILLIYYAAEEAFGLGLLVAAALAVGGFLAVAGMKVFIGMAKDLKAIRNKMEQ